MNTNKKKVEEFIENFNQEIYPTIEHAGLQRFREIVEQKRKDVEQRKLKRKGEY